MPLGPDFGGCHSCLSYQSEISAPISSRGSAPYAPDEFNIIPLEACRNDLTGYLRNLGVSGRRGRGTENVPTEVEIFLNPAGIHSLSKEKRTRMTVCPKRRYELTTQYVAPKKNNLD